MRAVTQNRRDGGGDGHPTGRVDALTFGLGSGIAGLAGVALTQIDNVSPNLGQGYIIDSFLVVVFGGVGNLWGTLVGALSARHRQQVPRALRRRRARQDPVWCFIILFIQKRPRGLFPQKGRRRWRPEMHAPASLEAPASAPRIFLHRALRAGAGPEPAMPASSPFHVPTSWWRCSAST